MKKNTLVLSYLISLSLIFASCSQNTDNSSNQEPSSNEINVGNKNELPIIDFEEEEHDFGKIVQGEKVTYDFKFTNVGKSNLVISNAAASCGCTVADFPKEPIPPGKSGKITVEFNSEGKSGYTEKTITVVTNCEPNTKILKIKVDIVEPTKQ
ncbi:MAG: hypothetical protein KatS3mg027_1693 [Bacteroidia bacterium]|nr:MAG: hypothetical protein KatS3mg027_1693 [Bacteroidia bacterium]